jgi:hypothetical protein
MGFREISWERAQWINQPKKNGIVAGCCEHGNEPTVSVKYDRFLRAF